MFSTIVGYEKKNYCRNFAFFNSFYFCGGGDGEVDCFVL